MYNSGQRDSAQVPIQNWLECPHSNGWKLPHRNSLELKILEAMI